MAIVAPEFLLVKYFTDLKNAMRQLKLLKTMLSPSDKLWSITNMLFADMGGFALRHKGPALIEVGDGVFTTTDTHATVRTTSKEHGRDEDEDTLEDRTVTRDEDFRESIDRTTSGSAVSNRPINEMATPKISSLAEDGDNIERCTGPLLLCHLDAYTLRRAIEEDLLPPSIVPVDEVFDKSKSDLFTNAITTVQILYFVISVIVRAAQDLTISQLEIGVVAFVACSFFTYCLSFNKPKGVATPIILRTYEHGPLPSKFDELMSEVSRFGEQKNRRPMPNDVPSNAIDGHYAIISIAALSVVLAAIHLAAWNFEFPTAVDLWLWRAAALVSAVALPMLILASCVDEGNRQVLLDATLLSILAVYCIARLVLVVEMFRCLCYAPPDTFTSTWTINVPHI